MANDRLAQIAADGMGGRMELLEIPQPLSYEVSQCVLEETSAAALRATPTEEKISTKEELYAELAKMRARYQPFLEDHAPSLQPCRKITKLKSFLLNGETPITIPHYGDPVGYAVQTYETDFEAEALTPEQAMYIRFEGADYIAFVYINGECVGTHEGFFSPFEFEITDCVKPGTNHLRVVLKNDNIYMGTDDVNGQKGLEGDKLYAATGIGYDDPKRGWHHCPPGMGIYNDVTVQVRNKLHVTDLFVRNGEEVWVEVQNAELAASDITLKLSVYGQNFEKTAFENLEYVPQTFRKLGLGDSLNQAAQRDVMAVPLPLLAHHGLNVYKVPIAIPDKKLWDLETPYLYQVQVQVFCDGKLCDTAKVQFGIRDFRQDLEGERKGMFYLNGRKIRLRGANTMGFEQQDVMREDWDQLIDDILLAKLCNMNFWRLTQRPVQDAVYEYCDKLGFMTQTDLPLFACMRRTKFAEGVRQAEEMERLIRNHPANVVVTYINEPIPNANNHPHRHMLRDEMEQFFTACDHIIRFNNPERVIKHVDGDYDPPSTDMPDNHCYPMWYNGHGIDMGQLNKGYWMPVKPGWYYGCGEYGAEGLDFADVMRSEYPAEWMVEPFDPCNIVRAQTGSFHYFFYDTPDTIDEWVEKSHAHQSFATSFMTEAFRRDDRMVSQAIHLFIDAWPSGWMKTIMDCKRNPKPAYFAYRNALEPLHISLRTDRYTFFAGEQIRIEGYICNDTGYDDTCTVVYELYGPSGKLIRTAQCIQKAKPCGVNRADDAVFTVDHVNDRERFTLKAILLDAEGKSVDYNEICIEVFEDCQVVPNDQVVLIEKLAPGEYEIAGERVKVKNCSMLPLHFASRKTGHRAVSEFRPEDFRNWYNAREDMITPLLESTFTADGFTPILLSGNVNEQGNWAPALAAAEKQYEGKRYVICQVDLRQENPVAKRFLKKIMQL